MKVKPDKQQEYNHFVEIKSKSFYSKGVIDYMHRWANLMEQKLAEGANLEDVVEVTAYIADTEGITGFMYNAAVGALYKYWAYGDELRSLAEAGKI